MSLATLEIKAPPCPVCDCRAVFQAVAPSGEREQPVYLRCCECGQERADLEFYEEAAASQGWNCSAVDLPLFTAAVCAVAVLAVWLLVRSSMLSLPSCANSESRNSVRKPPPLSCR